MTRLIVDILVNKGKGDCTIIGFLNIISYISAVMWQDKFMYIKTTRTGNAYNESKSCVCGIYNMWWTVSC